MDSAAVHPWHAPFAGKWCAVMLKMGGGVEGRIKTVDEQGVWFDKYFALYPPLQGVRGMESAIEEQTVLVPLDEVASIRTADHSRTQNLVGKMRFGHEMSRG